MRLVFLLLVLLVFSSGCTTQSPPLSSDTIQGNYRLHSQRGITFRAGECISLREGRFFYDRFTDYDPDPSRAGLPVTGPYTLDGRIVTLHNVRVPNPQRILTRRNGTLVMWTPQQYEELLRTGNVALDVLHQHPLSAESSNTFARELTDPRCAECGCDLGPVKSR